MLGVADQPARQLQSLAYFHPDADGGLLILGTGGSGKTVALRTLADQRRAGRRGQRVSRSRSTPSTSPAAGSTCSRSCPTSDR